MTISLVKIHGIIIVFSKQAILLNLNPPCEFKKKKSICAVIISPVSF